MKQTYSRRKVLIFTAPAQNIMSLFPLSTQSHFTMNLTGRTTTATECTCRPRKVMERSTTRTNLSTWPRPPPMATPASRFDSKPTPTTWISTPPHGGLQTGRTSSPAPLTPGCKNKTGWICAACASLAKLCGCVEGWGCMWTCVHLCWICAEQLGLGLTPAAFDEVSTCEQ